MSCVETTTDVRVDFAICGHLYFHQMTFLRVGAVVETHRHAYPHVLQVQVGRLRIWTELDGSEDASAPAVKDIPAGIAHRIESLDEYAVGCCIHELRDEAGIIYPFAATLTAQEAGQATARL